MRHGDESGVLYSTFFLKNITLSHRGQLFLRYILPFVIHTLPGTSQDNSKTAVRKSKADAFKRFEIHNPLSHINDLGLMIGDHIFLLTKILSYL